MVFEVIPFSLRNYNGRLILSTHFIQRKLEVELKRLDNLGITDAIISTDKDYEKIQNYYRELSENKLKHRGLTSIPSKYFETTDGERCFMQLIMRR